MRKRKAKLITPFIMLLAGLVTSTAMYLKHYPLTKMLVILLVVLIIFFIVGDTFRFVYEKFRPEELDEDQDDSTNKEIIADDDVEEEYRPQGDGESFSDEYIEGYESQQGMSEEDSEDNAAEGTSEDDFQEEEYMDSEEYEES